MEKIELSTLDFFNILYPDRDNDLYSCSFLLPIRESKFHASIEEHVQYIEMVQNTPKSKTQNIFYSPALLLGNRLPVSGRGDKDYYWASPGYWADMDIAAEGKTQFPPDLDAIKSLLFDWGIDPTMLVWSGRGVHAYWLFKEIWRFEKAKERQQFEILNTRLQATIRQRSMERGWNMDSTADVTRVLRPAGTLNNKDLDNPLEVFVTYYNENCRYEPDDIDEFTIAENELAKFANMERVPPQLVKRIEENISIDPQVKIDPDRLQEMFDIEPDIEDSWEGNRDFKSPSEYALSLANYAVQCGWEDQEIADLIIAFYARHRHKKINGKRPQLRKVCRGKYLADTIAKARRDCQATELEDYAEKIAPTIGTPEEKKADPGGNKALKAVNNALGGGFQILKIHQFKARKESTFYMDVEFYDRLHSKKRRVEIPFEADELYKLDKFKLRIAEFTGYYTMCKPKYWMSVVCPNFGKFIEVTKVGNQTVEDAIKHHLRDYLFDRDHKDLQDAAHNPGPFFYNGNWHIDVPRFMSWLQVTGGDLKTNDREKLEIDLTSVGAEMVEYKVKHEETQKTKIVTAYKIPTTIVKPKSSDEADEISDIDVKNNKMHQNHRDLEDLLADNIPLTEDPWSDSENSQIE